MYFFQKNSLFSEITRFFILTALAACSGTASAGGNSGGASPLRDHLSIPIEVIDSPGGKLTRPVVHEFPDRLYLSGSIKKWTGHRPPMAAHIDVQLIDVNGKILAEVQDNIKPSTPLHAARGGRHSAYVASFPIAQAKEAARIRVRYHQQSHTCQ